MRVVLETVLKSWVLDTGEPARGARGAAQRDVLAAQRHEGARRAAQPSTAAGGAAGLR